ncbi:hypothetical protein USB125703_00606 [Pseudoclavibacter triregionum]|nr:hypothetical protein USB125703_00606 [Pseudoclavibacter triregionum]
MSGELPGEGAAPEGAEPIRELDDAIQSVMNVESDAEDAIADDPEAPAGDGRDPAEVLRMDPSLETRGAEAETPTLPRDQI